MYDFCLGEVRVTSTTVEVGRYTLNFQFGNEIQKKI